MKKLEALDAKAQIALDYLMIMGYGVVSVLLVMGVLAYFGIFNPSRFVSERCILAEGLKCVDFIIRDNTVMLKVQNTLPRDIKINRIELISNDLAEGKCNVDANILLKPLASADFEIEECAFTSTGKKKSKLSVLYDFGNYAVTHTATGELLLEINSVTPITSPYLNKSILATFYKGELSLSGSRFGNRSPNSNITFEYSGGQTSLSSLSADIWRDDYIFISSIPEKVKSGTLRLIVNGTQSKQADILIYNYSSVDVSGNALPLAIAVAPDGWTWLNQEYHTELHNVSPDMTVYSIPIPQAPGAGIFATVFWGGDSATRVCVLGEDIRIDSKGGVWFTEGGELLYDGTNYNTARIMRYDPSTGLFDCYNSPIDNSEIIGVLLDENRKMIWYAEGDSEHGNFITGFKPYAKKSPDPSTVGIWYFDDTSGTIARDETKNNNGDLKNGASWTLGASLGGLSFDGIDDSVNISNSPSLEFPKNQITIEAWVKMRTQNHPGNIYRGIVSKRFNGGGPWSAPFFSYSLFTTNGSDVNTEKINFLVSINRTDGVSVISTSKLPKDNRYHHVVGVYNGTYVKLYIDGKLNASILNDKSDKTITYNLVQPNDYLQIGSWITGGVFNGSIDEVVIYNKALSDAEIADRYGVHSECFFDPRTDPRDSICSGSMNGCHKRIQLKPASFFPAHLEMDKNNYIWYTSFFGTRIGRLNPDDGQSEEFPLPPPATKDLPGYGSGPWSLGFDKEGNLWISEYFDATVGRFNTGLMATKDCENLDEENQNPCYMEFVNNANYTVYTDIHSVTIGTDGKTWFTANFNERLSINEAGIPAFISPEHNYAVVYLPHNFHWLAGVAEDPKTGDIVFSEFTDKRIGRLHKLE